MVFVVEFLYFPGRIHKASGHLRVIAQVWPYPDGQCAGLCVALQIGRTQRNNPEGNPQRAQDQRGGGEAQRGCQRSQVFEQRQRHRQKCQLEIGRA